MKKIAILALSLLFLGLQLTHAQNSKKDNGDRNYEAALQIYNEQGAVEEVYTLLLENIKEHPKHISSYAWLAYFYGSEGYHSVALNMIDKAIRNNHSKSEFTDAGLYAYKASIYYAMGDYAMALSIQETAVKMARKNKKDDLQDMLADLAQYYFALGDYDSSDKIYEELLDIDQTNQLAMIGLARNLLGREDYSEALEILESSKAYDSSNTDIYYYSVYAYEGLKEYKKMVNALVMLYELTGEVEYLDIERFKMAPKYSVAYLKQKIVSEVDNVVWKIALASLYSNCYKYSEALELYESIQDEYGVGVGTLQEIAACYMEMGFYEQALTSFNRIMELCEEEDEALYRAYRCDLNMYAQNLDAALEDASYLIKYLPISGVGYYYRGSAKMKQGDDKAALIDFDEGIEIDEEFAPLYLSRGELYHKRGEFEKAEADFEKVTQLDTTLESSTRHFALQRLGREREALDWMEDILEADPENPYNYYEMAILLTRMGLEEQAVNALRFAFEKGYRHLGYVESDLEIDPLREREDYKALMKQYRIIMEEEKTKYYSNENRMMVSQREPVISEVEMTRLPGGTYEVPCHVNGLPLKMIFDTGASSVTISSVEANFMFKNGFLTEKDIKGRTQFQTASGDIHEGTVIRLKEVKVGDAVLKNIEASVVHNQNAPLLLGQTVLERFGVITIDNVNSKLIIKQ